MRLREMARVVKPDGIVAIVFAHTDVEAWERLLRALRSANLWCLHRGLCDRNAQRADGTDQCGSWTRQ